jgi:hypothetical protein
MLLSVMAPADPLEVLGLGPDATADDIRAARRRLARAHHPDRGGDALRMQIINEAADAALMTITRVTPARSAAATSEPHRSDGHRSNGVVSDARWEVERDIPSFTVEALPVETFEALVIVASWMGEVLDDDPPYRLDTYLDESFDCWCRLDVVPDAGASTVNLTVAAVDGAPGPDILVVRDAWISNLNALEWP